MNALICERCNSNDLELTGGLLICQACGTKHVPSQQAAPSAASPNSNFPVGTVFARWSDGYFYPGALGEQEQFGDRTQIHFLDGDTAMVLDDDILQLDQAFAVLQMEGNWKHGGVFFKGTVASQNPMVMHYNDGDVEMIQLRQLRGAKPGEAPKRTWLERLMS
ncbi:MAG: hypothetical protein FWE40_00505 [Oscillospiraceae bacterium]|nr:hypothetical protein [Oscillospiraceae bacterium]